MNIVFVEPIGIAETKKKTFESEMIALGHIVTFYYSLPAGQDDLLNRAINADIIVVSNYHVTKGVVEQMVNLKLIVVAFTGVDHIPVDYCRTRGIAVCNAAGYSTQAVAELTIALAIDLLRKIVPFDKITRDGGIRNGFLGGELRGKTFGIIGFGSIGERVAKLAQAFECNVIAWSRSDKIYNGVEFVSLEELLRIADVISLHLPLNDNTRGFINKTSLSLMKSEAILINTARGPIVDSEALVYTLNHNKIAGAAIDVYENEPPIKENHPLFKATNTILLPHIGFATHEAINNRSDIVIENIRNWMNGNPTNTI